MSKFTFGSFGAIVYDASNPIHRKRSHTKRVFPSGDTVLTDHFTTILPKVSFGQAAISSLPSQKRTLKFRRARSSEKSTTKNFLICPASTVLILRFGAIGATRTYTSKTTIRVSDVPLLRYIASNPSAENFSLLCTIRADLSKVPAQRKTLKGGRQQVYRVDLELVLLFGLTEMQAQIAWKEQVCSTCAGCIHFSLIIVPIYRTLKRGQPCRSPIRTRTNIQLDVLQGLFTSLDLSNTHPARRCSVERLCITAAIDHGTMIRIPHFPIQM